MYKEENKKVKKLLQREFPDNKVLIRQDRGTASEWRDIIVEVIDPCPFQQETEPCSYYCVDRICRGNNNTLIGDWGDSVRQLTDKKIREKVMNLLEKITDNNYREKTIVNVNFIKERKNE